MLFDLWLDSESDHDILFWGASTNETNFYGYQRSGSTSKYAWTSTTPVSHEGRGGKREDRKDMPLLMAMHDIPYMATASPAFIPDLVRKLERAMEVNNGLAYIHLSIPCPTGWGPGLSSHARPTAGG